MIFEFVGNIVLMLVSIFFFINLQIKTPPPTDGGMSAKTWPQILLMVLIVCIIFNLIKVYKKGKSEGKLFFEMSVNEKKILSWKIWVGICLCFAYPIGLRYIGFFAASLMYLLPMIYLLGGRAKKTLISWSLGITIVVYIVFRMILGVPLPRGTGVFREFAIWLESFI